MADLGADRLVIDNFSSLFKAVSNGDLRRLQYILLNEFSIQAFKNLSSTLLHQAANNRRSKVLQYLIQHGAFVDGKNAQQLTSLHVAARLGDVDSLRVLLENGADINEIDYDNRTPLYFASYDGHIECVKELLQNQNIDVSIYRKGGWTHLHEVARFGHYECMKILIRQHGIKLMARTEDAWWTPAHMAASMGRADCLRMLIDEGVDINAGAGSHRSSTLLHEASHGGHKEIVQLLLDEGADPSLYDGHNLAHHVACRCGHAEVLKTFLEFYKTNPKYHRLMDAFTNVDPVSNSLSYQNSLHIASLLGHEDCLRLLVQYKARHLPNGMHMFPAMLAACKMHIGCLKTLLQEIKLGSVGAEVLQREGHQSALHHLCVKTYKANNKSIACACLLLSSGVVNINQYDDDWNIATPLYLAARNGAVSLVQYLLNMGADARLCGSVREYTLNNPEIKRCADMLDDARSEPMTLLLLCKLKIRKSVLASSGSLDGVAELRLPNVLKDMIVHGHHRGVVDCR